MVKVQETKVKMENKENFLNVGNFDAFCSSETYTKIQEYINNSLKSGYDNLEKLSNEVSEEMYNDELEKYNIINNLEFLKIMSLDYVNETYR